MRFFATCHPPRCAKCANRLCLNLGGQSTQTFNFCEVGWIAKRRSIEDRRAVSLKLSRKGEALVRKIAPLVQGVEAMLSEKARDSFGMFPL